MLALFVLLLGSCLLLEHQVSSFQHHHGQYFSIKSYRSNQLLSSKGLKRNALLSEACADTLSTDVLVVGSGISGSTAAYYCDKSNKDVILAEVRDEVGGNLISKKEDGYLWEEGPNSFQPNPAILRLAKDLGMMDDLVLADPALPRFVFWEGKLHALPGGLKDLLHFDLLTWPGKIRAGLGALGCIAPPPNKEETVREWTTRHLGAEAFERIIDPFVSGVYAGDPNKLSMRAALKKVWNLENLGVSRGVLDGAIVRIFQLAAAKKANAARDEDQPKIPGGSLGSFRDGLQSIPLKIKETLKDKVLLSHKLVHVQQESEGWLSTFDTPHGPRSVHSKALLLTSPAHATADILSESVLPAANELKKIYYPPVASVTLSYPNDAFKVPMVGFGNLIPRAMKIRTLGTIWSSSLFPGRAPAGHTMLLNYIGGAQDPEIASLSPEQIANQVHEDVKKILLKSDAPRPRVLGVRLWPMSIPQYERGHLEILERVKYAEKFKSGLFLGGNYCSGVAFGDCVEFGTSIAKHIVQFIDEPKPQQLV